MCTAQPIDELLQVVTQLYTRNESQGMLFTVRIASLCDVET